MTEIKQSIPARLKNVAVGGHVAGAEDIIDDTLNKEQSVINQETLESLSDNAGAINTEKLRAQSAEEALGNRIGTVEELATISIDGGEAQIATGEDFDNPDATKRAKVVTVGAVLDGADDEPTAGSENLVKSGGVVNTIYNSEQLNVMSENLGVNGLKIKVFSTNPATLNNSGYSLLLPIKTGDVVYIKPNLTSTICVLKKFDNFIALRNSANPFDITDYFATGESERRVFRNSEESTFTITAEDAKYLILSLDNPTLSLDFTPAKFSINQKEVPMVSFLETIETEKSRAQGAEEDINNRVQNIEDYITTEEEVVVTPSLKEGYYLTRNGVDEEALDNFYIASFPVINTTSIEVEATFFKSGAVVCFKDSNGSIVGDIQTVETTGRITATANVPSGATKVYSSYRYNPSLDEAPIFKVVVQNDLKQYIQDLENDTFIQDTLKLTDVIMVPIFGQSLSVGAAAVPIISNSPKYAAGIKFSTGIAAQQKPVSYFTGFVPLTEELRGASVDSAGQGETVSSGCVEKLLEIIQQEEGLSVRSGYWNNHKVLFVTCGSGSKTIQDLVAGYYQGLVNAIQGAKNICDDENLSFSVPAWIWIQGETDQKEGQSSSKEETTATDLETYKQRLIDLQSQLNTDVKSITGQAKDIKCICYQCGAQNIVATTKFPTYTNVDVMGAPMAQMQLIRDNINFVASAPVYILTHSTDEPIHLSAEGEKMLGLYCGIALKSIICETASPTGLVPISYSISGNTLTVKYKVPCPPLIINKTWIKEVNNIGFVLLDSSNTDIISNVEVFDDSVTITCNSSPINCRLFYGFNGTQHRDGRIEGSRGNLCDSAEFIFNGEVKGKRFSLGNYAYAFTKLLSENSGSI